MLNNTDLHHSTGALEPLLLNDLEEDDIQKCPCSQTLEDCHSHRLGLLARLELVDVSKCYFRWIYLHCFRYQDSYRSSDWRNEGKRREIDYTEENTILVRFPKTKSPNLRSGGRPLVTNWMLMQKEMTYLWAETARNSSHTDSTLYNSCSRGMEKSRWK